MNNIRYALYTFTAELHASGRSAAELRDILDAAALDAVLSKDRDAGRLEGYADTAEQARTWCDAEPVRVEHSDYSGTHYASVMYRCAVPEAYDEDAETYEPSCDLDELYSRAD